MEPYNYTINTAQQPNFETGFAQGQAMKQQEQQQQAQAAMQSDLLQLSHSPTVTNISSAMAKYPQLADKFKPLLESASTQQRQNKINQASDVYASLLADRPDIAKQLLQEHADAARNAGDEQGARSAEVMATILDKGDAGKNMLLSSAGMFLSSAMGPEKFADTYGKLGSENRENELQPSKMKESEATAAKAATAARFAESDAALDLQKKGWDITKIQNDIEISKQNAKIAMMNASIARESNDLKRQELGLKVQEMKDARDEKVRERTASVESASLTIDNMLSTAQQILETPMGVVKSATGPVSTKMPTLYKDTADFEELIGTLGSQTFLSQVSSMKGMGSLSNAEGEKLQQGLQNLSLRQSPERLLANVKEIQRLMSKARTNLADKYGVPAAPVDQRPGTGQRTIEVSY